jgi:hypothetical protein
VARGIYRELLDQCYVAGDFEYDEDWICGLCRCTKDQLAEAWKKIEQSFPKRDNGRRFNAHSERFRKDFFKFIAKQKKYGKTGAVKRHGIKDMDRVAQGLPKATLSQDETKRNETKQDETKRNETKQDETKRNETIPPQAVAEVSVMLTESDPGYWAERWYERHPRKRDLVLVYPVVEKLFSKEGLPLMRLVDEAHKTKCLSDKWLEKNGQYVPSLAKWLEDRGWTEPISESSPITGSKFEAAFRVFDVRGGN